MLRNNLSVPQLYSGAIAFVLSVLHCYMLVFADISDTIVPVKL